MSTATASVTRVAFDLPLSDREPAAGREEAADGPLLLHHAEWFCKLRWLVVAAMLFLAFAAGVAGPWFFMHGMRLTVGWPLAVAAVLAVANLGYLALLRMVRKSPDLAAAAHKALWLEILVDLAVLMAVVHFLGSVGTVAPLMVLFHIVLACIFSRRWRA